MDAPWDIVGTRRVDEPWDIVGAKGVDEPSELYSVEIKGGDELLKTHNGQTYAGATDRGRRGPGICGAMGPPTDAFAGGISWTMVGNNKW